MATRGSKCVNVSRHVVRSLHVSKATFSTSLTRRAEDEPPRKTSSDLLSVLDRVAPASPSRDSLNSVKLPTGRREPSIPESRTRPPKPSRSSPSSAVLRLIGNAEQQQALRASGRRPGELSQSSSRDLDRKGLAADLSRQITRRWRPGDVYAPHDLSDVEMAKWRQRGRPASDAFDVLDFNPVDAYTNFSIMSEFMTPMGRIMHSKDTGLRPINQRRIARAIRRSIGMGIMPSVYRHPEILYKNKARNQQLSPITRGPI